MNQGPYYNEPGYANQRSPDASKRYNDIIKHETLRCAVCDVLERKYYIPDELYAVSKGAFENYHAYYQSICEANLSLSGQPMSDSHGGRRGAFQYNNILQRLCALKASLGK
ncbi:unnamed protein product [Dibothriocephalus latus]|uniref:Uncharacterized protein n=1 Tax=Dibothriocephalus latus TaxID=60516 RepID=A0A3P7LWW4_DIBLA|nr:unnamed protein product [Dibothriocephalus latus]